MRDALLSLAEGNGTGAKQQHRPSCLAHLHLSGLPPYTQRPAHEARPAVQNRVPYREPGPAHAASQAREGSCAEVLAGHARRGGPQAQAPQAARQRCPL